MKHRLFLARFFLAAALVTAGLIFWFSAQKGATSQAASDSISLRLARFFAPDYPQMTPRARQSYLELMATLVRKNAHFCEFMLLGFNLMGAVRFYRPALPSGPSRLRAWGLGTLYAVTDELHQLFVNERAALATDVLIDSAGALAGTFVMALFLLLLSKWLKQPELDFPRPL
ncbi:MAG: VanZ family protein [Clostridia bacterium]|nr:VanZ family protein [Clostridia bacterium]